MVERDPIADAIAADPIAAIFDAFGRNPGGEAERQRFREMLAAKASSTSSDTSS